MYALAVGIGTKNSKDEWLEVYYPKPVLKPLQTLVDSCAELTGYNGENKNFELCNSEIANLAKSIPDENQRLLLKNLLSAKRPIVLTLLGTDSPLQSTPEAYLKLHLLSHRLVLPNEPNLPCLWESQFQIDS